MKKRLVVFLILVALPVGAIRGVAQTNINASLRGHIIDPTGAAVADTSLTLINVETNAELRR
jgi:hypothetical protein